MFDSIGWGEIFVIILAGLIIIGPERLPGVIMDVRAALFAARRAINEAKDELYGEEFEEFRKPMSTVTEYAAMGPKRAIAKVLFDEEGEYLDQFDPRHMMDGDPSIGSRPGATSGQADRGSRPTHQGYQSQQSSRTGQSAQPSRAGESAKQISPQDRGESAPPTHTRDTNPGDTVAQPPRRRRRQPGMNSGPSHDNPQNESRSAGFSWEDVT